MDDGPKAPATLIKNDVHIAHGLSCADCHGGDRTSDDPEASMSRAKGFKGKPARRDIPKFCASCHSNPDFMRRYAPRERVDQFELYQTSVHGKRLAAGDENVATCIDCHSVHDIRAVKDTDVAGLSAARRRDLLALPRRRRRRWRSTRSPPTSSRSTATACTGQALPKRGDLSAPNCASCHGNHGAKPPQVESVAEVCGTCHVLFAQLYDKSVHQPIFSAAGAGAAASCATPTTALSSPRPRCWPGPKAVCSGCHDAGTPPAQAAAQMAALDRRPGLGAEAIRRGPGPRRRVGHGSFRSAGAPAGRPREPG